MADHGPPNASAGNWFQSVVFLLSGQYTSPRSAQRFRDNDMRQNKDLKRIA